MLSQAQLDQYDEDGFLLVEDLLPDSLLQPAMDDIAAMVDEMADVLYDAGRITDKHADAPFGKRLALIEKEHPETSVLIHFKRSLRPGIGAIWAGDILIDIVRQMIGGDIAGHPIWNVRSKTPQTQRMTVPWHQDTAYLLEGAEHTLQPTAWIPFLDITRDHGPIQVVRGGHRPERLMQHYLEKKVGNKQSWYLYIPETDLPEGDIVTFEMKKGSVLFLNQLIPHRSLENFSDEVRWSIDLRWQDPALPSGMPEGTPLFLMRKADDPAYRPDLQAEYESASHFIQEYARFKDPSAFEIPSTGQWMDRWDSPIPEGKTA